jgi:RimJ/RimL family protein N-acetyltransferase
VGLPTLPNPPETSKGDDMQPPHWAPTLLGEDVTLRAHRCHDEDDIVAQCRDPLMQRWTTVPVPYEARDAKEWLATRREAWESGQEYSFAIEHAGRFAGSLDLRPNGRHGLYVGYGLAPWARGLGITRRALVTALRWAFDTLDAEIALWSAVAGNWASRRVAWSTGFRVEGTVRGMIEQRGIRLDAWVGSLRRGDPFAPAHPWYDPPVLTGRCLRLRGHRSGDIPSMVQACNDPQTQRWLAQLPRPYAREDARAHLEEIAEEQAAGRAVFWALVDPTTDVLVGEIGMWGLARGESRSAELGYWTHPAARGRRMTTEGVRLVARHALLPQERGGLGLARLIIRVAEGNVPSQRVAVGAGFRPTGRDRGAELLRDGTVQDLVRYDVLAGETG